MIDLDDAARRLNEHAVVDARPAADVLAVGRRYRRRRLAWSATSSAGAVLLVVAVAFAGTRGANRERVTIASSTTRPAPPPTVAVASVPTNEAIAARMAAQTLDGVVLPPGSQVWTAAPPAVIAGPTQTVPETPSLARHRVWTAPLSRDDVIQFLVAHAPRGALSFTSHGSGSGSVRGVVVERDLQYSATAGGHDPHIAELSLGIAVAARGAGASWIRADVQVVYRPERPRDESVSADDRVVVIERTTASASASARAPAALARVVVHDPAVVAHLRAVVDALPTKPSGVVHCPMLRGTEPVYVVSFQRSDAAVPDLVARTGTECPFATSVTVHGAPRPLLEAGELPTLAQLLAAAAH